MPATPGSAGDLVLQPMLTPGEFLPGLALALAIGILIGVERGWRMREEESGSRVAGVRTFALVGLLGGLIGIELPGELGTLAVILAAGAVAGLLLGYAVDMRQDHKVSATSMIAAVLTLGLGATATSGHMALASVGAGAAVILLASRDALHRAIEFASENDIKALIRLVLVVFVILPLLPNVGMGPFGALNPQRLWLVVVITGAISFAGYILARWLGQQRGALLTAAVGSLVSSTAVTVDSARRVREGAAGLTDHAAVAIASATMLTRSLVLVSILAPFAMGAFARMVVPGLIVSLAGAAVLLLLSRRNPSTIALRDPKPPGLGLAFLFALSVAVLSVASAWAESSLGSGGGAILIAVGGTADIDAAIAAAGALPVGTLPLGSVALALAAPTLFNTLFKLALFMVIAGWRLALAGSLALGMAALTLLVPIVLSLV
ncbi:MAG: DUF4010 domain-containing protein [Allosphingosinicella sp.]